MDSLNCWFNSAPTYLKDLAALLCLDNSISSLINETTVLELCRVGQNKSTPLRYFHLLFRRHVLTEQIIEHGLYPPAIYERALVYEALGYADLAAADAFVTYTLCEVVRSDDWISDLEPIDLNGEPWPCSEHNDTVLSVLCGALSVLYRSLVKLGAEEDAEEKLAELVERYREKLGRDTDNTSLTEEVQGFLRETDMFYGVTNPLGHYGRKTEAKFGWSRREIYPWNNQEPDRNSSESLSEINSMLSRATADLEAKVTTLPALDEDGSQSSDTWHQLGLFAATNLASGLEVLREKSLMTAIRPLDDALCDACGADLESMSRDSMRQCPGEDCDTTFCSEDCATRAAADYHNPNLPQKLNEVEGEDDIAVSDSDSDYPPPHAPFCSNTALHEIGRTASTTTPEWDLYFLLLTRTIQMSTTQRTNPLSLPTIKYLWGDFNPPPDPSDPTSTIATPKLTLPWSLHHNLTLPLQYFETLMHSVPDMKPYSAHWLANFDWWIQSTLLAKFRGVANAQQSTFDGKPEIAAVHPMWCLANHSCEPNVRWTPTGERVFTVREPGEMTGDSCGSKDEWTGIKAGEEIWSHYTDVRLPVKERRERLMEVLGGVCRCTRCLREAKDDGN